MWKQIICINSILDAMESCSKMKMRPLSQLTLPYLRLPYFHTLCLGFPSELPCKASCELLEQFEFGCFHAEYLHYVRGVSLCIASAVPDADISKPESCCKTKPYCSHGWKPKAQIFLHFHLCRTLLDLHQLRLSENLSSCGYNSEA